MKVKDFACRSKAKAKPHGREPVDYSPRIIPMKQENLIDVEPIFFDFLNKYNEKIMEPFIF